MGNNIEGKVVAIAGASSGLGEATPGAVQSELSLGISDPETAARREEFYRLVAIPADAVAQAIAFAIAPDVDINETLLRPTAQQL